MSGSRRSSKNGKTKYKKSPHVTHTALRAHIPYPELSIPKMDGFAKEKIVQTPNREKSQKSLLVNLGLKNYDVKITNPFNGSKPLTVTPVAVKQVTPSPLPNSDVRPISFQNAVHASKFEEDEEMLDSEESVNEELT